MKKIDLIVEEYLGSDSITLASNNLPTTVPTSGKQNIDSLVVVQNNTEASKSEVPEDPHPKMFGYPPEDWLDGKDRSMVQGSALDW